MSNNLTERIDELCYDKLQEMTFCFFLCLCEVACACVLVVILAILQIVIINVIQTFLLSFPPRVSETTKKLYGSSL